MKLTASELLEYTQKHGITLVRTTKQWRSVPKGTKLWFNSCGGSISTWDQDTNDKNKKFGYTFDYLWSSGWHDTYEGKFIIEQEFQKFKVGDKIRIKGTDSIGYIRAVRGDSEMRKWNSDCAIEIISGNMGCWHCYCNEFLNWEDTESCNGTFGSFKDLELAKPSSTRVNKPKVNKLKFMQTLTNTLKKILPSDIQKQYRANFRDGDLALTGTGKNELLELLADKFKKELTERAIEVIKEEEKK